MNEMNEILESHKYLWESKNGPWVLVKDEGSPDFPYVIFNIDNGHLMSAEEEIISALVNKMLEEGVSVIDEMPEGDATFEGE